MKRCFLLLLLLTVPLAAFAAEPTPEELTARARRLTTAQLAEVTARAQAGEAEAQTLAGLALSAAARELNFHGRGDAVTAGEKYREAVAWFRKAAEQGYAPAQYFLAEAYEEQRGVALDCAEVTNRLKRAAGQEYAAAMMYLGYLYYSNRCVSRDYAAAWSWFKKASDAGNARGSYWLAKMYEEGDGVAADQAEANRRFTLAAEQGDAEAQNEIGIRLAEGIGTQADNRAGVAWFRRSAAQGNVYGACNLALHYARGAGVAKSRLQALKWSFISNSLDGLKCRPDDFLEFLKPREAQVKTARRLAAEWLRAHPQYKNNFGERPWLNERAS